MNEQPIKFMSKNDRQCGECTACCEGWLSGYVHGRSMFPGRKCFYLGKQCTIYEDRPESPCKSYTCSWINDKEIPEWMRPDLSGVIITKRSIGDIEYQDVVNTNNEMSIEVLNYIFTWGITNRYNIAYKIKGWTNKLGTPEFLDMVLPSEERY